jgi:hypothetical protein
LKHAIKKHNHTHKTNEPEKTVEVRFIRTNQVQPAQKPEQKAIAFLVQRIPADQFNMLTAIIFRLRDHLPEFHLAAFLAKLSLLGILGL